MKTLFLFIGLLMFGNSAFSQQEATINIVGHASKLVTPDKAIFSIQIRANRKTESESYKAMTDISNEVLRRLEKEGFVESQIKLTDYSIQMEYDYTTGTAKKKGYISSQSLILKFPLDKRKIISIYGVLSADDMEGLSIHFSTECSDILKDKVQNELIIMALNDAKQKANLIATTTDTKIKSVADVSYKVLSNPIYPQAMNARFSMGKAESMDVQASDFFSINEVEFNEEVKVTYWIQNLH